MTRLTATPPARTAGFTLIELLIVIGILGLLATVLLPRVLSASQQGNEAETRARIVFLSQAADAFERKVQGGYYPPDDGQDPEGKLDFKADRVNLGIESLVAFLARQRLGRDNIVDHETWFANTDSDKNPSVLPGLDRTDKVEVVDAWGMPLAYFVSANDGYARKQVIRGPGGSDVDASAMRNPRTGKFMAPGKYQILSAGQDGLFNTEDDLTWPEVPKE